MSESEEERMTRQLVRKISTGRDDARKWTHGHRIQTAAGHEKHKVYPLQTRLGNGEGRKTELGLGKTCH